MFKFPLLWRFSFRVPAWTDAGRFGYCMDPNYADEPYGSRVIPGMRGTLTDYEECMVSTRRLEGRSRSLAIWTTRVCVTRAQHATAATRAIC